MIDKYLNKRSCTQSIQPVDILSFSLFFSFCFLPRRLAFQRELIENGVPLALARAVPAGDTVDDGCAAQRHVRGIDVLTQVVALLLDAGRERRLAGAQEHIGVGANPLVHNCHLALFQ